MRKSFGENWGIVRYATDAPVRFHLSPITKTQDDHPRSPSRNTCCPTAECSEDRPSYVPIYNSLVSRAFSDARLTFFRGSERERPFSRDGQYVHEAQCAGYVGQVAGRKQKRSCPSSCCVSYRMKPPHHLPHSPWLTVSLLSEANQRFAKLPARAETAFH